MEVRIARICIHFFQQNMHVFVVVIGNHSDDDNDGCGDQDKNIHVRWMGQTIIIKAYTLNMPSHVLGDLEAKVINVEYVWLLSLTCELLAL